MIGSAFAFLVGGEARIVGVQIGHHDRYDRVVLELTRTANIVRRPETRWQDLIVDLDAVPQERHSEIRSDSLRMGTLVIEETPGGARLSSTRRDRRLRLFRLEDPPRLVVDFADPDNMVLSAPRGAWAVPVFSPAGPELAYSSSAEAAGGAPVADEPSPGAPTGAREPAHAGSGWLRWVLGLPVATLLGLLLAVGVRRGLEAWRRLRASTSEDAVWLIPSIATREVLSTSTNPTEMLARRHDEEVSARMQLEERVHQLQEEVRQLRDGLTRLARRGEDRA